SRDGGVDRRQIGQRPPDAVALAPAPCWRWRWRWPGGRFGQPLAPARCSEAADSIPQLDEVHDGRLARTAAVPLPRRRAARTDGLSTGADEVDDSLSRL